MDVYSLKRKRAVLADVSNNGKDIVKKKNTKAAIKPPSSKKSTNTRVTRAVNVKQKTEDEIVLPLESISAINEASLSEIEVLQIEQQPSFVAEMEVDGDPEGQPEWIDIDGIYDNYHYMSEYANDVFEYYKERESLFAVPDYMHLDSHEVTEEMRAILVDWLVEVQQSFELNHEILYSAIKIFDLYVSRNAVRRSQVQLIGAVALFVSCKFDERSSQPLCEFTYICDDAYCMNDFIQMEIELLKDINFSLGLPLSYTFLRRYAQCARVEGITLTLARYILETSLMYYQFVKEKESVLACASLYLAMTMNRNGSWDGTMLHYTGRKPEDFMDVALSLNRLLANSTYKTLRAIKLKYSHIEYVVFENTASRPNNEVKQCRSRVFQSVSRTPLISDEMLIQFNK